MDHAEKYREFFIVITMIVIGTISFVKIGTIDLHAVFATGAVMIPAAERSKVLTL